VSDDRAGPERVALSREFSELLVELSIALHKHAIYPSGHPALEPAVAGVTRRAERLLEDRQTISFGVARHQLIIEGVATDPSQPVLRRLAEGLHRHHLGAISISRGVDTTEMGSVVRALAAEVERDGPLGLGAADRLSTWTHVRLHPLTFDRLELIDDEGQPDGGSGGPGGSRGAELWMGLVRAALATDAAHQPAGAVPTEPSVVARAIDEHQDAQAYDQVIVGYLLQIAGELKTASGAEAGALRRRTARLIGELRPETLRRLIEMGGDVSRRHEFVLDATHGMAVESVIEILKAAADASGQTISHGLVRMLSKLAAHAELGQAHVRPLADDALREQVHSLLSGWQLEDPNPDAYRLVLQHVATTAPLGTAMGTSEQDDEADSLRIVQMSLEVGELGPLVDRAIDRAVTGGAVSAVLELLKSLPDGDSPVAEAIMTRLLQPSAVATLVAREPLDVDSLDALFPQMSIEAYAVALDALAASPNRATRRKLLDRLPHTDLDVGPLLVERLGAEEWFVQRNMLLLLETSGRAPAGFSATPWTRHADARVRHAALRLQLTLPWERDVAIRTALEDDDPRTVRLGLAELQQACPPSLATTVAEIAINPDSAEELRLLAIRALGRSRERTALKALVRLVDGGKTFFGRRKLAPRTPALVAATRALAQAWAADRRAATMLAVARRSSDPEVRQAATPGRP
jgi:hypothetical protein